MDIITAQEAKEKVESLILQSNRLRRFFDYVEEAIDKRERCFTFYIGERLSNEEIDYISSLGYKIYWSQEGFYDIEF